jgi:trehalose-phosphatase
LQVLTPDLDVTAFEARIAAAQERVLMLDYDGTLAPFQVRPELAVPYPEAAASLRDIVRCGRTRVVIVSGRPADEVPPLLGLEPRPEIWGSHGRERLLPDGARSVAAPAPAVQAVLADAARAVQDALSQGARIETKLASVALHWRGLSDAIVERVRAGALARWEPLTRDRTVEMLAFDGGVEIRASGYTKANAVRAVLSGIGEDSAVAYLGDDMTDEDAFRAIKPRGLAVLVRPELRETAADVWLRPPAELASFLQLWAIAN